MTSDEGKMRGVRTGLTFIKERDGIRFYGEITASDMMHLNLDQFDRRLMDDTGINAPAADTLLVLEMLFRRMQEQFSK